MWGSTVGDRSSAAFETSSTATSIRTWTAQGASWALIAGRHAPLRTSDRRYERALARYRAFRALHPDRPVDDYPDRHRWM
jgi:hypothetical protein